MRTFLLDAYMEAFDAERADYRKGRLNTVNRFRSSMLLRNWCHFLWRKSKRSNGAVQRRIGVPGKPRAARKPVKASRPELHKPRRLLRVHPIVLLVERDMRHELPRV